MARTSIESIDQREVTPAPLAREEVKGVVSYVMQEAQTDALKKPEAEKSGYEGRLNKALGVWGEKFDALSREGLPDNTKNLQTTLLNARKEVATDYENKNMLAGKRESKLSILESFKSTQSRVFEAAAYFRSENFFTEKLATGDYHTDEALRKQATSSGEALRKVFRYLPIKVANDLKTMMDDPRTFVRFNESNEDASNADGSTDKGVTRFEASSDGQHWFNLDDLTRPESKNYDKIPLNGDTLISITVTLYRNGHSSEPRSARIADMAHTFIHEIGGHVLPSKSWLDGMRTGSLPDERRGQVWRTNHTAQADHKRLTLGENRNFNEMAKCCFRHLNAQEQGYFYGQAHTSISDAAKALGIDAKAVIYPLKDFQKPVLSGGLL